MIVSFAHGVGVSRTISEMFRERIGRSLRSRLLQVMMGAFSVTPSVAREPQGSVPFIAMLIDLRLSDKADLTDFIISSLAIASLFSKGLKSS